jgi:molecular chaperone DnaK (HSP70)
MSNWMGGINDSEEKAPSTIAYASDNTKLHSDTWEHNVPSGMVQCRWVKLLLDVSTKSTNLDDQHIKNAIGSDLMRLPKNKDAKTVVTDLLRLVYRHVIKTLNDQLGMTTVAQTTFRVVVTVPATWSLAARLATKQAAQDAGFASGQRDEMMVVEEPEAATLWVMKSEGPTSRRRLLW